MSGKIERLANRPAGKIESAKVETPVKTAAVTRTTAEISNTYLGQGRGPADPSIPGSHVGRSARPDALWGNSPAAHRGPNMDPHQFDKLTPVERKEKLTELRAQRDELQVKILERVVELDAKWEKAPAATKEEALNQYADNSQQLDPEGQRELRQMLRQAAVAQRRIDALRSRRDGMPAARHADAATKLERAALNKELRAARKEHKECVKEATAVVDEKGLKIDRLAVTEQVIDPSAPKQEDGKSLMGMVTDFFKFTWLSDFVMTMINDYDDRSTEKKVAEAARQREAADTQAHLMKVSNREAIKKLAAASELAKSGS
jgi:hypothetical protein